MSEPERVASLDREASVLPKDIESIPRKLTEEFRGILKAMVGQLAVGRDRQRRIWELRERITRLQNELGIAQENLAVEEQEHADERLDLTRIFEWAKEQ
jgi:hypothetical protein